MPNKPPIIGLVISGLIIAYSVLIILMVAHYAAL